MILLDSTEILEAVGRSLETHVLPKLDDEFARVQVRSALKAMAEVGHRLEHGDPCARMNAAIDAAVREIADRARSESDAFAASLTSALDAAPPDAPVRDRARRVGEALWSVIEKREHPACADVLEVLRDQAKQIVSEDAAWMCPEAILSLT